MGGGLGQRITGESQAGDSARFQVMASRPTNPSTEANARRSQVALPERLVTFHLTSRFPDAIGRCWKKALVPDEWGLAREQFFAVLERSIAHRFGDTSPNGKAIEAYLESLHVSDLALALACSAGNAAAWDFFVGQFRPELYRAARAIAGEANARELADSLYAELYGLRESDGQRKSLFDYFHGRSKLSTWLRAVLAQRHIDEIRRLRKTEPLEDDSGSERGGISVRGASASNFANAAIDTERTKYVAILQATLADVLESLEPRDRLRLAYYYVDDRTLAEIGRSLGEHEATVSRKLERTRRDVRARVETALRTQKEWTEAQIRLCFEYARGQWPFDLSGALGLGSSSRRPTGQPDAASARDLGD